MPSTPIEPPEPLPVRLPLGEIVPVGPPLAVPDAPPPLPHSMSPISNRNVAVMLPLSSLTSKRGRMRLCTPRCPPALPE